jgi:hypothetical protein
MKSLSRNRRPALESFGGAKEARFRPTVSLPGNRGPTRSSPGSYEGPADPLLVLDGAADAHCGGNLRHPQRAQSTRHTTSSQPIQKSISSATFPLRCALVLAVVCTAASARPALSQSQAPQPVADPMETMVRSFRVVAA